MLWKYMSDYVRCGIHWACWISDSKGKNVLDSVIRIPLHEAVNLKSKETYGQTRGLSALEMICVGGLAIIGVSFKAVKTSRIRTTQGRTYLTKRRLLLHTHYKHIRPE